MGVIPHVTLIKQVKADAIPEASYLQEHPELRPHVCDFVTVQLRLTAPEWLRSRGGVVVYLDDETKSMVRYVPRCLRLEHMPGFFSPFEAFHAPLAGPDGEGRTFRAIDWVKMDYELDADPYLAALYTLRKAFGYRYKDNKHVFDILYPESLWQPDPTKPHRRALAELTGSDVAPAGDP